MTDQKEQRLQGLGVSTGIAIGPASVQEAHIPKVEKYTIDPTACDDTRQHLMRAVTATRKTLLALKKKSTLLYPSLLNSGIGREITLLLDAHLHMLDDGSRLMRLMEHHITGKLMNASWATFEAIEHIASQFQAMKDPYLSARAEDVRELGMRLLRHIDATSTATSPASTHETPMPQQYPHGHILLAQDFTPADTVLLDPLHVLAIATESGGRESHTAIMARALGIPAVLGVYQLTTSIGNGDQIVLDGDNGLIITRPNAHTIKHYHSKRSQEKQQREHLATLKKRPACTTDQQHIHLLANIELPRECAHVDAHGAEGIGLVRSEFLYMNRDDLPDEEEQYHFYKDIVCSIGDRPVTIRTLDVGGEKLATSMGDMLSDKGENPALGLRAIRFALKHPHIFRVQLAAILRAFAQRAHHNSTGEKAQPYTGQCRILLPMISCAQEIIQARAIIDEVAQDLTRRHIPLPRPMPSIGIMIETPSAAVAADTLAPLCDFFSIGTNDLTMYTLAIDRGNEEVAHLYTPLHPAVLRLIHQSAQAAHKHQLSLVVCGEIAGDPFYAGLLIGLGVKELSMNPTAVPRVKQRILHTDSRQAKQLADKALKALNDTEIIQLLEKFHHPDRP